MGVDHRSLPYPIAVTDVAPLPDYRMVFIGGKHGIFDMSKHLDWTAFRTLRNPGVFRSVSLECGVPTWPSDIDVALERLYTDCVPAGE